MYILRKILAVLKRLNSRPDSAIPIFSVVIVKTDQQNNMSLQLN